ncbi:MAG: VapB-type antitoxin [Promethearchaeota archaeon]
MGTVMLKEDTKTKLIKIAADLQKKRGKRVDFDETISYLIDLYFNKKKNWKKFEEFCKPIKDLKLEDVMEELKRGRMEDEKKFSSY